MKTKSYWDVRQAATAIAAAALIAVPAAAATTGECNGPPPFRTAAQANVWLVSLFSGLSPEKPQPKDYFERYFAPGAFETLNGARVEFPALKAHFDNVREKATMVRYTLHAVRATCDGVAESHLVEVRMKTGESFSFLASTLFRLTGGRIAEIIEIAHKVGEEEKLGGLAPR